MNKRNWDERILLINLEGLGDLVLMTGILKYYKKDFPAKKIYLLVNKNTGFDETIFKNFIDKVLYLDYRKFASFPWYGFNFINSLRRIGFFKVINQDPSIAEIEGKIIAASIGAQEIIGYEGLGIQFRLPFDINMKKGIEYVRKKIMPQYTKIIPSLDKNRDSEKRLTNFLKHYIAIYQGAGGSQYSEYIPEICVPDFAAESVKKILQENRITAGKYCLLSLGTATIHREWEPEKFAAVLNNFNLPIILVGTKKDHYAAVRFHKEYKREFLNLIGKTSVPELVALVKNSLFSFSNDTSLTHIAVALKIPSLTIVGLGHLGMLSLYGYPDINKWVYSQSSSCLCDNWRCIHTVPRNKPASCIAAVTVSQVVNKAAALLNYLRKNDFYPRSDFQTEFPESFDSKIKSNAKIKIIYAGIQAENYNPQRKLSFEYSNFYNTFETMENVEVIEYPYDPIIQLGKKRFNENLLNLIKNEKPDLFFAFMFTDELDNGILEEIKKLTTSLVWFADDHWRLDNYSRFYAPHFTWAVTTWSKAPEKYRRYGITNVIRSQWACNTEAWKPVNHIHKDIDVSFLGQYNSSRGKIINELRRKGIDILVRGWGWPEGRISQEEMFSIIGRSKINLNFNFSQSLLQPKLFVRLFFRRSLNRIVPDLQHFSSNVKSWLEMPILQIKARPFEILGCRAFLISGYADDMKNYYKECEEIVYYNGMIDDLVKKIEHYLPLEKERERMATLSYERTIREHTYKKRFADIFKKIGIR